MAIASVPKIEPEVIYAGDTITWKIENSDYKASSGWTLKYDIVNSSVRIAISSSASGDDHLVEVSATTTANYTAGEYKWRSYVTNVGGEKYGISEGRLEIKTNLTTATSGYDFRSTAKKVVDALESALAGDTTGTNLLIISQSCGDLNLSRKADVYTELQKWKKIYQQELDAENLDQGREGNVKRAIYARMSNL